MQKKDLDALSVLEISHLYVLKLDNNVIIIKNNRYLNSIDEGLCQLKRGDWRSMQTLKEFISKKSSNKNKIQ